MSDQTLFQEVETESVELRGPYAMPATTEQLQPQISQVISQEDAVLAMIERAARDTTVDIDKMERLMAMRRDDQLLRAKQAFIRAMAKCQGEIKPVAHNAENKQTNSTYAKLDAIGEAIDPIIAANGFSLSFDTADSPKEGQQRIICYCAHEDGFERVYHHDAPPDDQGIKGTVNKTPLHAMGSTDMYLRRYLTLMIFNVKTKKILRDDDGNAAGSPLITDDQLEQLHKALLATKSDIDKFCQLFKIEALSDLAARKFDDAMACVAKKAKVAQ